jgi:hypothetical protein
MATEGAQPAVYMIRNRVDGRTYIGASTKPAQRWRFHLTALRHRRHHCAALQLAWDAAGAEAFEHILLEIVPTYQELHRAETRWIRRYLASHGVYNTQLHRATMIGEGDLPRPTPPSPPRRRRGPRQP